MKTNDNIIDLKIEGYPVIKIYEKYIPIYKEVISKATNDINIDTIIRTHMDIFNVCIQVARGIKENEVEASIWAFEKLYEHGFVITNSIRHRLKTDENLQAAYKAFMLDRKKKRMESHRVKVTIEFLNEPSKEAKERLIKYFYNSIMEELANDGRIVYYTVDH